MRSPQRALHPHVLQKRRGSAIQGKGEGQGAKDTGACKEGGKVGRRGKKGRRGEKGKVEKGREEKGKAEQDRARQKGEWESRSLIHRRYPQKMMKMKI